MLNSVGRHRLGNEEDVLKSWKQSKFTAIAEAFRIERLRRFSGLALASAQGADAVKSHNGIVCALDYPELDAIREGLGRYFSRLDSPRI